MGVVINDLADLKNFIKLKHSKKKIEMKFDDVVFNCVLPHKRHFNYFCEQDIQDYDVSIIAKSVTFNYPAEIDNLHVSQVVANDSLICELINVIGDVRGAYIATNSFIGIDITAGTFVVKNLVCRHIKVKLLVLNNEDYPYLKADAINNIGV